MKLKCDQLLSNVAFRCNPRLYATAASNLFSLADKPPAIPHACEPGLPDMVGR